MLATDSRESWSPALLDDPRVRHFWDPGKVVGRWFAQHPELGDCELGNRGIAWDAFYLFGPDARWEDAPQPVLVAGCPIVREEARLLAGLAMLAEPPR